jgi:hypothetical protein
MTETIETIPEFKIESLDDLRDMLVIAKGGDPKAVQAIANFMDLKSTTERSYFPDKTTTLAIAQLNGMSEIYFKDSRLNPFKLVAESIETAFMALKGFKSIQFVDMTRQTPNLSELTTSKEEVRQGMLSRILGGKKE